MLSPTLTVITQATGRTFSAHSTAEEAVDYLLSGGWWAFCGHEQTNLDAIIGERRDEHAVFGLLAELEPDRAERALAIAYAARARVEGDPRAEAEAARRWVYSPDEDDATQDESVESLSERFPGWGWQPVRMLVHEPPVVREARLAVILPDRRVGQLVLTVVDGDGPDGLWPDPRTMMFADIDPQVQAQLSEAWSWTVNQDRFRPGRSVFWTLLDGDVPFRRVDAHPIAANAAAALSFALGLTVRAKSSARMDTVLLAGMKPSGALAPVEDGRAPVAPAGKFRVLLAEGQSCRQENGFRVDRVSTVGEGVAKLRRRHPGRAAAATVLGLVVVVVAAFLVGTDVAAEAAQKRRDRQADELAALAVQSQRPDEAILLALAATKLRPDRILPQDSLIQALYGTVGLDAILPAVHGTPRSVALSSTIAATGADDGTIGLQDLRRRTVSIVDEKLPGPVLALAFSPDSRLLAAAGGDQVTIYDTTTGRLVWRSALLGAQALAFDTGSATLAAGGASGDVVVHPVHQGDDHRTKRGAGAIRAVALLPGGLLAAGGDDRKFEVLGFKTEPPNVRATFPADSAITSIAVNAKRDRVAAGEYNGRIRTYTIGKLTPAEGPVRTSLGAQLITPPGGGATMLSATRSVLDFDVTSLPSTTKPDEAVKATNRYPAGTEHLGAVAVSPDGESTAVPSDSGALLVWRSNVRTDLKKVHSITGAYPVPGTRQILIASGGSALQPASGLILLDRDTGLIADLKRSATRYDGILDSPLIFDPESGTAVVRDRNRVAQVYQVHGRALLKVTEITQAKGLITATTFDPAHRRLLIARKSDILAIPLDRLSTPSEIPVYQDNDVVSQIKVTPDGRELIVGGRDGVLVVPLNERGQASGSARRLTSQLPTLTAMSDNGALVTATTAGIVTLYRRTGSGEWAATPLPSHAGQVTALAVAGNYVVSGGADAEVRIHDLREDRPVLSTRLPVHLMPKTFWQDGPAVVSSSDMSLTSINFALEPAAAVHLACTMGGWSETRPRIGDVAPAISAEYSEIKLCDQ